MGANPKHTGGCSLGLGWPTRRVPCPPPSQGCPGDGQHLGSNTTRARAKGQLWTLLRRRIERESLRSLACRSCRRRSGRTSANTRARAPKRSPGTLTHPLPPRASPVQPAGGGPLRAYRWARPTRDRVLAQCAGIVVSPRRPGRPRKSPPTWPRTHSPSRRELDAPRPPSPRRRSGSSSSPRARVASEGGINNKLRMIARRAYGYHSAKPLIAMLYLCSGGIVLDPPLPTPTET